MEKAVRSNDYTTEVEIRSYAVSVTVHALYICGHDLTPGQHRSITKDRKEQSKKITHEISKVSAHDEENASRPSGVQERQTYRWHRRARG
jgi:hypothetical protein